jgi:hypothetical protein
MIVAKDVRSVFFLDGFERTAGAVRREARRVSALVQRAHPGWCSVVKIRLANSSM